MKIFLDYFCFSAVVKPGQQSEIYKNYQHVDQLPDACDLISITFNNNNYSAHADVIQQLLYKTSRLIVVIDEPTEQCTGDFYQFVQAHNNPNIRIFSPVIANFFVNNFCPLISWFLGRTDNYYATDDWAKKLLSQLHSHYDRPKRFDCLLGSAKSHRDSIEQLYRSSNCQDHIVYNYFKDQINQGIWSQNINRAKATTHLIRTGHRTFAALSNILPVDIYNQTFYSIVAETVCTNQYSQYTEKTAKPIVAGRPFIVFSGQYFLRNLCSLGFQTFGAVIDESYDDVENETERLARAWHEVERLCRLDPQIVMLELQSVLEHNRQHFLQTDWMQPLTRAVQSINTGATGWI